MQPDKTAGLRTRAHFVEQRLLILIRPWFGTIQFSDGVDPFGRAPGGRLRWFASVGGGGGQDDNGSHSRRSFPLDHGRREGELTDRYSEAMAWAAIDRMTAYPAELGCTPSFERSGRKAPSAVAKAS